jgi:AraC-like DNA-binding protein
VTPHTHRVQLHRSAIAGIEAMTLHSDHAFPRHSHDTFGIGVMLTGAQRSWSVVGQVEAEAGDVLMLNPGEMHDGSPIGGPRAWRIIYIDPHVVRDAIADDADAGEPTIRPVARDAALGASVARLFGALRRDDVLLAEESLACCLMRAIEHHEVRGQHRPGASPSISRALQRLDEAPEIAVSLEELARCCGITRFQLLRGFAREVGTTPHAYLVQRRVRLARRLLAGGASPAEAALQAGFSDQPHMTRVFTRHVGITPGRYRKVLPS